MKSFARLFLIAATLTASAAHAADFLPYTDAKFDELTKAKQHVIVDVHADWCPTCRAQQPVLKQVVSAPPYDAYTVLVVNFDTQQDALKRFNVVRQSTLVVFSGTEERARSTGYIDTKSIDILLNKGL
jgi:thioredoxin 1